MRTFYFKHKKNIAKSNTTKNQQFFKLFSILCCLICSFQTLIFSSAKNHLQELDSNSIKKITSISSQKNGLFAKISQEEINLAEAHYSIFINEPTYTFAYSDKIYFVDDYDKKLKCYDTSKNEFISEYVELATIGTIIDATICEGVIFFLSEINNASIITKIDLNKSNKTTEYLFHNGLQFSTNATFAKLFVNNLEDKFYISLTPSLKTTNNTKQIESNPIIIVAGKENFVIESKLSLIFGHIDNALKTSIKNIFLAYSSESTDYVNMIFVCEDGIYGLNLQTSLINSETEITLDDRSFYKAIDSTNVDTNTYNSITISNVSLTEVSNKKYLFISYEANSKSTGISSYTKVYEINIALGIGSIFQSKASFATPLTKFIGLSNSTVSYPSNQEICMFNIDFSDEENISAGNVKTISNPNLNITFLEENNFEYVKTNKQTILLASPWNSSGIITIEKDTNLIIIGSGYIENQNNIIEDFKYCLYSANNRNYLGYIKLQDISEKEKIDISDYFCTECTVVRGTALYSLPTKVLGEKITSTITSKIITTIPANTTVEILDVLCGYSSNSSKFLKVKVGETVGYIEENQIVNKNDITVFIINNATIRFDATKIYSEENKNSSVLLTLKEGDRIKVVKPRNKQTGFCKIEYSDIYGNVITGYVDADFIKNDSWSVMQIVGGILIAVNLGILILIIHFIVKRMEKNAENENNELNENSLISDTNLEQIDINNDTSFE